ncbi:hypothetical protein RIF29_00464 [Crotalaria pallida]|uniref:Uncharacterized protein n=1 Tax=Crotalaria pallida TaxID=3830 RepID=A0AAN9P7G6_CROPI
MSSDRQPKTNPLFPFERAVLAPPTWRLPKGEGSKRTPTSGAPSEAERAKIEKVLVVRKKKKVVEEYDWCRNGLAASFSHGVVVAHFIIGMLSLVTLVSL